MLERVLAHHFLARAQTLLLRLASRIFQDSGILNRIILIFHDK
jgi:hypothetical protein